MAQRVREHIQSSLAPAPSNGECTRRTTRCPDARDYGSELRECCKGHLRKIVTDCAAVFGDMGVTWWADYGTLLGAVRNPLTTWADYPWLPQGERSSVRLSPGVVPHDKDCDFGVLVSDWRAGHLLFARAAAKLQRHFGYHVMIRSHGRSMKVRLSYTNHTNADFFAWMVRSDGVMVRQRYINADRYKGREFPRDMAFPLGAVLWEGMSLPAPKDPVAFCRFRYGENWMKPVRANHDGVPRA